MKRLSDIYEGMFDDDFDAVTGDDLDIMNFFDCCKLAKGDCTHIYRDWSKPMKFSSKLKKLGEIVKNITSQDLKSGTVILRVADSDYVSLWKVQDGRYYSMEKGFSTCEWDSIDKSLFMMKMRMNIKYLCILKNPEAFLRVLKNYID